MNTHPSLLRSLGLATAWGLVALGTAWIALYLLPGLQEARTSLALLASFIPYGVLTWLLAAWAFAGLGRRRLVRALAVPCVALFALQASWTTPYWPHAAPTASGSALRLLTVNVNFGKAGPEALARELAAEAPDVVVLNEIQAPLLNSLSGLGALTPYQYRIGTAPAGYAVLGYESDAGTMVLSRTPLTVLEQLPTPNGQYVVRIERPAGEVTLFAGRPRNVLLSKAAWLGDFATLTKAADQYAAHSRLIIAGDLNAVLEHAPMQRLLAVGLTDAASASGRGYVPTYVAGTLLPPMIPIDHVLTNDRVVATDVRPFGLPGTDHLGLVADLVVTS